MSGLVVKSYDGRDARRVVAGMVTDGNVLERIAASWPKEGPFGSPEANLVARWCVQHFRKFKRAPGTDIKAVFESWAESRDGRDAKLVDSVGRLPGPGVGVVSGWASASPEGEDRPGG